MRRLHWTLSASWLSLAGAALTTVSAVVFLVLFAIDSLGFLDNPYIGLLTYVALPTGFVLGLLCIPIGNWYVRRDVRRTAVPWPTIDFKQPSTRHAAVIVAAATTVNIIIISMANYGAVHYMETPSFCGQVCHTVMQPEFVAYLNNPHARVACVDCHVGGGAGSFARSKLSGVRQLALVALGRYQRPIPVPVRSLRPARDTCEHCHWPEEFHGDKTRVVHEYADDAANTETVTTLRVHVGGGGEPLGIAAGIHWHMNVANEIEYIATDDKRQVIPYVRLKDRVGNVREYVVAGVTPEQLAKGERRRMDCIDCHSRPSHTMSATAERAVDEAIAIGSVDRSLPFVRREMVKALKEDHASQDVGVSQIGAVLRNFYRMQGPLAKAGAVDAAVATAQRLYRVNVFPSMKVTWGAYTNEVGHVDSPGCFRCHDDDHKTKGGKAIGQDCETCHHIEGS